MNRPGLWPVLPVWLGISALLLLAFGHQAWTRLPGDSDDLMRLMQVRDWLGGQSWWDVTQHRMDPPSGVPMHWSRLVDLPVAGLIVLFRPFGAAAAEGLMLATLPLLTLAALMTAVAALTRRFLLGDRAAPALAAGFVGTSFFVVIQMIPGRIDHHGWQMVAAAVAMLGLFDPRAGRGGVVAGVALATGLAISLEGLPFAVALGAVAGLRWAMGDAADGGRFSVLALSLAMTSTALFVATRPAAGWFGPWCDVVTPGHLAALGVIGVGGVIAPLAFRGGVGGGAYRLSAALAERPHPNPVRRLLALSGGQGCRLTPEGEGLSVVWRLTILALLAGLGLTAFLAISPTCAADPFGGLDPLVRRVWYANVLEGQPVWRQSPAHQVQMLWLPLVGLAGTLMTLHLPPVRFELVENGLFSTSSNRTRGESGARPMIRRDWLTLLALLIAATLIGLAVRRAIGVAHLAAIPGAVAFTLALFRRARTMARPVTRTLGSAMALLLPSPLAPLYAQALLQPADAPAGRAAPCDMACALGRVAALPAGDMLTPIDLGAPVLSRSRHRVVAGPYHRAPQAIGDVIRAYAGSTQAARAIVRRRHLAYVLIEPGSAEAQLYRRLAPDGLMARLATGNPPAWLAPVPLGPGPLRLWRVTG